MTASFLVLICGVALALVIVVGAAMHAISPVKRALLYGVMLLVAALMLGLQQDTAVPGLVMLAMLVTAAALLIGVRAAESAPSPAARPSIGSAAGRDGANSGTR